MNILPTLRTACHLVLAPSVLLVAGIAITFSCRANPAQELSPTEPARGGAFEEYSAAPAAGSKESSVQGQEFLKIYKSFHSGKTGKPTQSIEIFPNGVILIRDAANKVLERSSLSQAQVHELNTLMKEDELIKEELSNCEPLRSTDADFVRIGIEKKYKIVIFKVFPNCAVPTRLARLNSLLDAAARIRK